jgi:hypothetical protein
LRRIKLAKFKITSGHFEWAALPTQARDYCQNMKITTAIVISILAPTLPVVPSVFAQPPTELSNETKPHRPEPFANLSAEERQKFESARHQAMQDPAVRSARDKMRQAHREFNEALRATILKNDPSMKPILDKMPPPPERERD